MPILRWSIAAIAVVVVAPIVMTMSQPHSTESAHLAPILASTLQVDQVDDTINYGSPLDVDTVTGLIYMASKETDKVQVIDEGGTEVVDTIATTNPVGVAVDSGAGELYVANEGPGTASVFDLSDNSLITTIPIGSVPADIAINESLGRVYVANAGAKTLTVIDTVTRAVASTLSLGTEPVSLAVNPATNTVYVARLFNDSLITVVDYGSNGFTVGSIDGLPFDWIRDLQVDPATGMIYVGRAGVGTAFEPVSLVAIDGATEEIAVIGHRSGTAYYGFVAVNSEAGVLYAQTEDYVYLLSTADYSVIDQISPPPVKMQMVVNPAMDVLYVLEAGPNPPDYIRTYDDDSDGDGAADVTDNCPQIWNTNQADQDGDDIGNVCDPDIDGDSIENAVDPDDDDDGVYDAAEGPCGSDSIDQTSRPERADLAGDDDGDGLVDEALPAGSEAFDCDGDGYVGTAEAHVFGESADRDQDACGTGGWPSDFVSGGIPDSTNRVNILDLASFVVPVRYVGTNVGTNAGDVRWDLSPGPGPLAVDINVLDIAAMTAPGSATGAPPMFYGARAFLGPDCPWAP